MKAEDIPFLKKKVLDMLPITQSEMWKTLGIGHRDGSKLINIMLKEELIKRKRYDGTFLIERLDEKEKSEESEYSKYSPLLSKDGKFSPCCGCARDCNIQTCELLTEWVIH